MYRRVSFLTMRIVVAGSREFTDYNVAEAFIDQCITPANGDSSLIFISGGCRGADKIGEMYAKSHGFQIEVFPADWEKYGRKAGPIRNRQMAQAADMVICFWDGKSKGTKSMIECAVRAGKAVMIKRI